MNPRLLFALPLSLSLLMGQQATPESQLLAEIRERGHAMADLQTLGDEFGPRLTGSDNLRRAQAWMEEKFRAYGAAGVHEEAFDFGKAWTRGEDSARMLTQGGMRLNVAAMAWAPPVSVRAEVALLEGDPEQILAHMDQFKGKIVLMHGTRRLFWPWKGPVRRRSVEKVMEGLKSHGALAILTGSEHGDGKLTMLGSGEDSYLSMLMPGLSRMPFGFLQPEHEAMLARLLEKGEKVELELKLGGTLSDKPVQAYNVIGELRGSEKPDEVVIVGAHLDAWDLATGTTDNGTGSIAVLETLRAIRALGLSPRRTMRFVLFAGEEQGELGSRAYVKAHAKEMDRVQAMLNHDTGAGRPQGFNLFGRPDLLPFITEAAAPAKETGATAFDGKLHLDSDQDPFAEAQVPAFILSQDLKDYFASTHHSQVDTIEHVEPKAYLDSVAALAVTAWELANQETRLPHKALEAPAEN